LHERFLMKLVPLPETREHDLDILYHFQTREPDQVLG
jgi:hypothetical protein